MPAKADGSPVAARMEVVEGDITTLDVDAIVNAANSTLMGGGGVDGAIHRAAGPQLKAHNQTLDGCPTGLAKITPGFGLEAQGVKHIIHTVGPVWQDEPGKEDEKLGYTHEDVLLASCYTRSLELATQHHCRSVAFPAISTGVYRFPRPRAAKIAVGHAIGHLQQHAAPGKVIFCCFNEDDAAVYRDTLATLNQWMFNRKR